MSKILPCAPTDVPCSGHSPTSQVHIVLLTSVRCLQRALPPPRYMWPSRPVQRNPFNHAHLSCDIFQCDCRQGDFEGVITPSHRSYRSFKGINWCRPSALLGDLFCAYPSYLTVFCSVLLEACHIPPEQRNGTESRAGSAADPTHHTSVWSVFKLHELVQLLIP